jgi:3-phenylpropionate/trans-cinnamate dioxygenase ferredoxin subunit
MAQTYVLGPVVDVPPGQGKVYEAGEARVAVFNIEGRLFAIDDVCTHDGASLAEGEVHECVVTCPWHGAEFDLRTGAVRTPPATENVRSYPVMVRDGRIEIEL